MAAAGIEEKIEIYVKQQPEWFENLVLGCAIQDAEFYRQVKPVLCLGVDRTIQSNDFRELLRNSVYGAVSDYNTAQMVGDPGNFIPISGPVLAIMLRNRMDDGDGIMEDEIPRALELFAEALEVDTVRWKPMVMLGISAWLTDRKMMQVIQSPYIFGGWSLAEVRERLSLVDRQTSMMEGREDTKRNVMGYFLDNPKPQVQGDVLPTNIAELNKVLGGGFFKGDGALVISPPGGGKTVLACQLAGHWAMNGHGGIFVTTEQPQDQLERRLLSNFVGIPFNQVVQSWDPNVLDEKQLHDYKVWRENMKSPIQVVDWTIPGKNIIEDLRREVEIYIDTFKKNPEYMIFDWVGGALQEMSNGDDKKLRALYKSAVDTVCYLCAEYKMAGVILAQATPGTSLNKFPITIQHIADAKNMAEKVTVVVGLTALFAENMDQETDTAQIMYHERQYLCTSKTRKGPGGNARVGRNYAYQRLENI